MRAEGGWLPGARGRQLVEFSTTDLAAGVQELLQHRHIARVMNVRGEGPQRLHELQVADQERDLGATRDADRPLAAAERRLVDDVVVDEGRHVHQFNRDCRSDHTFVERPVKIEPNPVAVDLDGDGVEEIVVPVNQEDAGRMAVVFRGPAGYRMQVVNSGFEGMVTGLGAVNEDGAPALVAAVAKRVGFLRLQGDSQLLMTVPE